MNLAGFKLKIPTVIAYGDHLENLVYSCLESSAMDVFVTPNANRKVGFSISGKTKGYIVEEQTLFIFYHWVSEQLEQLDIDFSFQFRVHHPIDHTALYAAILFTLYEKCSYKDKLDYNQLIDRSMTYLNESQVRFDASLYLMFLKGGTRFDLGQQGPLIRQSFPRGYQIVMLYGIYDFLDNGRLTSTEQVQSVLSLYHGMFFAEWKYIKKGMNSSIYLKQDKSIDDFLIDMECCYGKTREGYLWFLFPNNTMSDNFSQFLKVNLLENKSEFEHIVSAFSEEGVVIV